MCVCVCRLPGIGRQLREHNINLSAATADPAYHHHVLGCVHVLPRTLRVHRQDTAALTEDCYPQRFIISNPIHSIYCVSYVFILSFYPDTFASNSETFQPYKRSDSVGSQSSGSSHSRPKSLYLLVLFTFSMLP